VCNDPIWLASCFCRPKGLYFRCSHFGDAEAGGPPNESPTLQETLYREDEAVAEPFDGKSILVVDDDREIVTAIKAVFDEMGADVTTAGDGNTAINLALSDNPDLVVLDAMLPGRSGFLVLEQLKRAAKQSGHCPGIIMITGNQGKRHQVWAESLGVDDYLNKPFRMERLVQSAEKLLGS
jgi:CheY-like chemotaxis protein